jgi:hypothetical protein
MRLGHLAATVALLLPATSALAQSSVDVRVRADVPAKRCGPADYMMVPLLGIAPRCQARAAAADRKEVLTLLAQGRCEDAIAGALRIGDLNLAKEVRSFCASAPASTEPASADPTDPAPANR